LFCEAAHEYIGLTNSIAKAPAASSKGKLSTFETAISLRTGLRTYQEDKTKKKNKPARDDSLVKGRNNFLRNIFIFLYFFVTKCI
jgi:hypothetical protein